MIINNLYYYCFVYIGFWIIWLVVFLIIFTCSFVCRRRRRRLLSQQLHSNSTIVTVSRPIPPVLSTQQYQTTTTIQYPYNTQTYSAYGPGAYDMNTNAPPSYNSIINK